MDLSGGGNVQRLESGAYAARGLQIIDIGTHPNTHPKAKPGAMKSSMYLVFEVSGEFMTNDEGEPDTSRPFVLSKEYTKSLGTKSNLYRDVNAWRAKKFTDEELAGDFQIKTLLDFPCLLTIEKVTKGGKSYNNITNITALPAAMPLADRVNDLVYFEINDCVGEPEAHAKVWPWLQKKIVASAEGKELGLEVIEKKQDDDDVPF